MNKKGLTEMVLKMIIGIAGLLILAFLASQIYNMFLNPTEYEQAKAVFKQLVAKIDRLENGQELDYQALNPEGWVLISSGNTLYMCKSVDEDVSAKLRTCVDDGLSNKFDFQVDIPQFCSKANNDHCLLLKDLPLTLKLKKDKGVASIALKVSYISEGDFGGVLDLEGSSSKSIRELASEYAISENKNVEEEMEVILENYFKKFDSSNVGVDKDNFEWAFFVHKEIYINNDQLYKVSLRISSFDSDEVVSGGEPAYLSEYEFRAGRDKYKVVLKYYDGEDIVVSDLSDFM